MTAEGDLFYGEFAEWWPVISPMADYAEESAELIRLLTERRPHARTLLELGSGGGHVARYLREQFVCTLSDLSPAMIAVSQRLNPDCTHVVADLRTLDLERTFDLVLVHDAIAYMTSEDDLQSAFATARRHLAVGGVALFAPDEVRETFEASTEWGGGDAEDGRSARLLEWCEPLDPLSTTAVVHYAFLLRSPDGTVRSAAERHVVGVFPQRTWEERLALAGFEVEVVVECTEEERTPRLLFIGTAR